MFMKADHLATLGRRALNAIVQATRGRIFMGYQDIGSPVSLDLNVTGTQQISLDIASPSVTLTVKSHAQDLSITDDQSIALDVQSHSIDLEVE